MRLEVAIESGPHLLDPAQGGGRVVDFVGHAGAQSAQGRQLLALPQHHLLLQVDLFEIAEILAAQAGAEPGLEKHGVERLGEIVLGTHFDAVDGAVELVQRRDDDHRDVAAARRCS